MRTNLSNRPVVDVEYFVHKKSESDSKFRVNPIEKRFTQEPKLSITSKLVERPISELESSSLKENELLENF